MGHLGEPYAMGLAWVGGHTCAAFTRKYLDCLSSGSCMSLSFGIASREHMHWRKCLGFSFSFLLHISERCDAMIPQGKGGGTDKGSEGFLKLMYELIGG